VELDGAAVLGQVGVAVELAVLEVQQAPVVPEVSQAPAETVVSQVVIPLAVAQALVVLAEKLALTGWAVLDGLSLFLEVEIVLGVLQFQLDIAEGLPLVA